MNKILVVDDVSLNLKNISNILGSRYKLTLVKSGKQALRALEVEKPNLILLDVLMPEMDGFETFEAISRRYGTDIPVIFLTAVDDKDKVIKILSSPNVIGYILKPYNPNDLAERVDKYFLEYATKEF